MNYLMLYLTIRNTSPFILNLYVSIVINQVDFLTASMNTASLLEKLYGVSAAST
jgi:hypothetical protein